MNHIIIFLKNNEKNSKGVVHFCAASDRGIGFQSITILAAAVVDLVHSNDSFCRLLVLLPHKFLSDVTPLEVLGKSDVPLF